MRAAAVVLYAWCFLAWSYNWAKVIGPFESAGQCEGVRAQVSRSQVVHPIENWGGVSPTCWTDTAPLPPPPSV
jgi:hypothetical protein